MHRPHRHLLCREQTHTSDQAIKLKYTMQTLCAWHFYCLLGAQLLAQALLLTRASGGSQGFVLFWLAGLGLDRLLVFLVRLRLLFFRFSQALRGAKRIVSLQAMGHCGMQASSAQGPRTHPIPRTSSSSSSSGNSGSPGGGRGTGVSSYGVEERWLYFLESE